MHSRSAEYHISSRKDNHARTSVHRTACPLRPDPLIPEDLHPLQIYRHKESLRSGHPCRLRTVRKAVHSCVRYGCRLHRKQERYERYRYHRSWLHNHRRSRNVPFSSASQRHLPHTCTEAHTPCTPDPYQHKSPVLRKLLYLLLPGCPVPCLPMPLQYNRYNRQQPSPSGRSPPDSRTVQRWKEGSREWWSMPGNMHPRPLP